MVKIIDTNLILRLILGDIPQQVDSTEKLLQEHSVTVLNISIFECVYTLEGQYSMDRLHIVSSLQPILLHPKIECDNVCVIALNRYMSDNSLSFADCYLLESARQQNGKLYTFDKALIKTSAGTAKSP